MPWYNVDFSGMMEVEAKDADSAMSKAEERAKHPPLFTRLFGRKDV